MPENSKQDAERITGLFARVMMRQMTLRSLAELDSEGLSLPQLQCLRYLAQHGQCRLGQISEGLSISSPAATKLIERLVKKGLVRNSQCARDRRSSEIDLTEQGRKLIEGYRFRRLGRLEAALSRMQPADRDAFLRGLESFVLAALEDEAGIRSACLRCGREHDPECILNQAHIRLTGRPIAL